MYCFVVIGNTFPNIEPITCKILSLLSTLISILKKHSNKPPSKTNILTQIVSFIWLIFKTNLNTNVVCILLILWYYINII